MAEDKDRPRDVPQWAWEEANASLGANAVGVRLISSEGAAHIARAIIKAREEAYEAAAKIAEDDDGEHTIFGEDRNTRVSQATARAIASAIRQHSQKGER